MIAIFGFDQWAKSFIIDVDSSEKPFPLEITSFLNLVLTWNRGISFGMLSHVPTSLQAYLPWALTLGTLAIVVALFIWFCRAPERLVAMALGFIIGGALGNIADRLRFGAVVDFLDFHWGALHWPAFNIADSSIFIGVALLLLSSIVKR